LCTNIWDFSALLAWFFIGKKYYFIEVRVPGEATDLAVTVTLDGLGNATNLIVTVTVASVQVFTV
jgi:hypothetical protein